MTAPDPTACAGTPVALVTGAFALSAMSALAVAPLAPLMRDALELSRAQVGLFVPAVYLGGVLMALPAGWLVDRLGVRATLALGQLLTGASVVLAAASSTVPLMLVCLIVAGFGFAVVNPATSRAIIDWFPPLRRGVAMGIKQTGLTLGGIAGALLLPPLARSAGVRRSPEAVRPRSAPRRWSRWCTAVPPTSAHTWTPSLRAWPSSRR